MGETNKIDWEPAARRSRGEKKEILIGKVFFLFLFADDCLEGLRQKG